LRLLAQTTPWTTTLTAIALEDRLGAPTPAVALADRLGRTQLNESWGQMLAQYDAAARAIRSAHRLQLTLTWHDRSHSRDDTDRSLGIDD